MKKILIASLVALSSLISVAAHAGQTWTDSYQQGTLEFYVQNSKGESLAMDCRDTGDNFPDQSLSFTDATGRSLSSKDDRFTMVFKLDGDEYQMISPYSNVGMSNWSAFFAAVKKSNAKTVTFYFDGHQNLATTFPMAGLKALAKEYKNAGCFFL